MKRFYLSNSRGFTLVELMVVIAVIGVLATGIIVMLTSANAKSRDARRISDVKAIQQALEAYRSGQIKGDLPASTTEAPAEDVLAAPLASWLKEIPTDPANEGEFTYKYKTASDTFPDTNKYYIKFKTEDATSMGPAGVYCATSHGFKEAVSGACTPE